MSNQELASRQFSTGYKLIWSLAAFGTSLISGVYGAMLQYFYQTYLRLPANWISIAAGLYAIWNAINDPLFGFISDATRSRRGRRIPYMRYTAPFLALTFILVWFVPPTLPDWQIFVWMLVSMLLYDTAYTIIGLVYSALLPEVTESDKERGELQKYASIFMLVGTIFGFLLPDLLRPKVGSTSLIPLYVGMVVIGISGAICVLLTTIRVKERPEFTRVDKPLGFVDSIKYTIKNKSFIILVSANFMSILVQAIIMGSLYYLADYVLRIPAIIPLAIIFIGLLAGTFFANILASRFGVAKGNQIMLVISGVPLILLLFVPNILVFPCLVFAGFGLSGPLVLTNVLFGQVCDEDETRTGVRR
ncbi:MAG: MFS transporter, partial [Promethearchaeota archaeon]